MAPPEIPHEFGLDNRKTVKDEGMQMWKLMGEKAIFGGCSYRKYCRAEGQKEFQMVQSSERGEEGG